MIHISIVYLFGWSELICGIPILAVSCALHLIYELWDIAALDCLLILCLHILCFFEFYLRFLLLA
jgi:hypothetical protein